MHQVNRGRKSWLTINYKSFFSYQYIHIIFNLISPGFFSWNNSIECAVFQQIRNCLRQKVPRTDQPACTVMELMRNFPEWSDLTKWSEFLQVVQIKWIIVRRVPVPGKLKPTDLWYYWCVRRSDSSMGEMLSDGATQFSVAGRHNQQPGCFSVLAWSARGKHQAILSLPVVRTHSQEHFYNKWVGLNRLLYIVFIILNK